MQETQSLQNKDYFQTFPEHRAWSDLERTRFKAKLGLNLVLNNPGHYLAQHAKGTLKTLVDLGFLYPWQSILGLQPQNGVWEENLIASSALRQFMYRLAPFNFWKAPAWVVWTHLAFAGVLFMNLCFAGWALVWTAMDGERVNRGAVIAITLVAAYLLLIPGPVGASRFRVPASGCA